MALPQEDPLKTLARAIVRLEELLDRLPVEVARDLRVRIATLRTVMLEKRPPALVLVGRRGAGKSSLVNALFGAKVAELGHVTAQTGRGRWYDYKREGGSMSILDTRGVQEGSPPVEDHDGRSALDSLALELRAKAPDLVVFVAKASEVDAAVDADVDVIERVYKEVKRAHRTEPPLVAVVTHCDLFEPKGTRLHRAAEEPPDDVDEKLRYVAEAERVIAAKIDDRPRCVTGTSRRSASRRTCRGGSTARSGPTSAGGSRTWPSSSSATCPTRAAPSWRERREQGPCKRSLRSRSPARRPPCARASRPRRFPSADIIPLTTMQAGLVAAIAWIAGRSIDRRGAAEFLDGARRERRRGLCASRGGSRDREGRSRPAEGPWSRRPSPSAGRSPSALRRAHTTSEGSRSPKPETHFAWQRTHGARRPRGPKSRRGCAQESRPAPAIEERDGDAGARLSAARRRRKVQMSRSDAGPRRTRLRRARFRPALRPGARRAALVRVLGAARRLRDERLAGRRAARLCRADAAAQRDGQPAHGPRADDDARGRARALAPHARLQRPLAARDRPRRNRDADRRRARARARGQVAPRHRARGVRRARVAMAPRDGRPDPPAAARARRERRLVARQVHDGRGHEPRRDRGVRARSTSRA